jgi:lipoprotein-anchoring transpeptidase ErfK/SrfK
LRHPIHEAFTSFLNRAVTTPQGLPESRHFKHHDSLFSCHARATIPRNPGDDKAESAFMKAKIFVLGAAAILVLAAAPAGAQDRYGQRPPVMVSPDLSAPWVMQLGGNKALRQRQPQVQHRQPQPQVRHHRRQVPYGEPGQVRVTAQPTLNQVRRTYQRPPSPFQTAGVPAPAKRELQPQIDPMYLPQDVAYDGKEKAGTIIIDTTQNFLYLVKADGQARRYGVGTGKPGFEWAGTHKVTQKREWPDWRPPAEMITRERAKGRVLPVHMEGGPANPLGARALYLGSTLYRIHGTNQPWTIGGAVSSGCIRMRNEDVVDLYEQVGIGTKVVVM